MTKPMTTDTATAIAAAEALLGRAIGFLGEARAEAEPEVLIDLADIEFALENARQALAEIPRG